MTAAVVGYGMVSPSGLTPRDHAFFVYSGVLTPPPSPFVTADEQVVDVIYCPWLGAVLPIRERLVALAETALRDALAPFRGELTASSSALVLCTGRPRPGLSVDDIAGLKEALASRVPGSRVLDVAGDAGALAALPECMALLDNGSARIVILVAVDSFVSVEAAEERVRFPPSYWSIETPPPSEAAAVVALMKPDAALRGGLEVLGTIRAGCAVLGASNDENDEPVDGSAMAAALRSLDDVVGFVFGQDRVDSLRKLEWHAASARNGARFDPACAMLTPETEMGRVGAAAGLVNLVQGLAMLRHGTVLREIIPPASRTACAWAISPDGTRGIASFVAGGS